MTTFTRDTTSSDALRTSRSCPNSQAVRRKLIRTSLRAEAKVTRHPLGSKHAAV